MDAGMGGLRSAPKRVVFNHQGARSPCRAQDATTCLLVWACGEWLPWVDRLGSSHSVILLSLHVKKQLNRLANHRPGVALRYHWLTVASGSFDDNRK